MSPYSLHIAVSLYVYFILINANISWKILLLMFYSWLYCVVMSLIQTFFKWWNIIDDRRPIISINNKTHILHNCIYIWIISKAVYANISNTTLRFALILIYGLPKCWHYFTFLNMYTECFTLILLSTATNKTTHVSASALFKLQSCWKTYICRILLTIHFYSNLLWHCIRCTSSCVFKFLVT